MMTRFFQILSSLIAAILVLTGLPISQPASLLPNITSPIQDVSQAPADLLQFQSGGHALGFAPDGMVVSNGTYALRVEFVGANAVAPQAANSAPAADGAAPQLAKVTYPNLWPGVTLTYDASGGIARSSYTLAPRADPAAIRLRYNAPVTVGEDGSLRIAYETGDMRESAPLAWQEMGGTRMPVEVAFALLPSPLRRGVGGEVSFRLGRFDPRYPLTIDPTLTWNTFLGGSDRDGGSGIAVDGSGNVYVVGFSTAAWGNSPVRAYTAYTDAFVTKLGSDGHLIWHTFLGGNDGDIGKGIAVDGSGNVYVVGYSGGTWGSPVRPYTTGSDAFVAKLGNDGRLTWNTFLGGSSVDYGFDIAVDGGGNVYVVGESYTAWGSPVRAFTPGNGYDAFVAKLSGDGGLGWNTFLGGSGSDYGGGIAVDGSGNVYVAGNSGGTWGSPVRPYTTGSDAFVAKLGNDGRLTWNTFLGGGDGEDSGSGIAVGDSSNVYVVGCSGRTWGSPVRAHSGNSDDAFVAKLGSDGRLVWHTFLGGSGHDRGYGIAVDGSGNIHVTGESQATWGSPVRAFTPGNGYDAFVAKLSGDGGLGWNTFLGGSGDDAGGGIAVDGSGNIYVTGASGAAWGSPVRAFTGGSGDAFVAKISGEGGASSIVGEARLDIGMPYNTDRGCLSPYNGCGGPFHGFYYGVCTDLALDAYNYGIPFGIQDALYQDHRTHPGRYRWGSARNAEDMRRYFSYNQLLLPHSQAYQPGDIAFFDWNGDGLSNHVSVVSDVDANGRPLRMVDATGVYQYNPTGLAFEHGWSGYYDQRVQGHGRLNNPGSLAMAANGTVQFLRITVDSPSVALSLQDSNGKSASSTYDENLVASSIDASIPYIPGSSFIDTGLKKVITVTQPLSNTDQYFVELIGQTSATYHLRIETLQDSNVTHSMLFTQTISSGETHGSAIVLDAPSGVITFSATSLSISPKVDVPIALNLAGLVGTSAQANLSVAELSGLVPIQDVIVSTTDLWNQNGGVVAGTLVDASPHSFTVPAGGSQDLDLYIALANLPPGDYLGSLILTSANGGTYMIPLTLEIKFYRQYLPLAIKD